jgi:hypothetical protein
MPIEGKFGSQGKKHVGLETQKSSGLGDVAEPVRLDHFLCLASPLDEDRISGDFREIFCRPL